MKLSSRRSITEALGKTKDLLKHFILLINTVDERPMMEEEMFDAFLLAAMYIMKITFVEDHSEYP